MSPQPPRTVVHVITTMEAGGAQCLLLDTARHVDPAKYRIRIAYLHGTAMKLGPDDPEIRDFSRKGMIQPFAFLPLARWMRREKAAIVHTHLVHADLLGRWAARLARVRRIVTTRHYGIDNKLGTRLYRMADRAAKRADAVIAISDAVRANLVARRVVPDNRIAIIRNGVDLDRFDPDRYPARKDRRPGVIGAVGRLHPQKGYLPFLDVFRAVVDRIPQAKLEIIGEGPLRPQLEARIAELGLEGRVHLPGACPPHEMPERLASYDLFVMPSRWEGFGIAAAEAMAMRVPVVASTVEGLVELIDAPETGLLVSPAAPDTWMEVIVELIGDAARREAMGVAARRRVEEQYSIRQKARRLERLYDLLLADGEEEIPEDSPS
jgi:glycosyltransferase involved in cell wall biosynthesis